MKLRTLLFVLAVVSILQLGLLWIQGAQLYRQQETLQALRLDIQELAEIIDSANPQSGDEGHWSPSTHRGRGQAKLLRVAQQEEEGVKENRESREAAQKAINDAHEAQRKLSISEAAKRAEELKKVQAVETEWTRWVWIALALVALALMLRAWLRRR